MKKNSLFGKTGLLVMLFATLLFAASCVNQNGKKTTAKKIDQESVKAKTAAVQEEAQDTVMFKKKLQFFKKYDLNNDKKISQKEYMSMASAKFEQMDKNHDGKLSVDEYDLVSTIAPKGQNYVTKAEFIAHCKSKFQTMDKNKDGYIIIEELDVREN